MGFQIDSTVLIDMHAHLMFYADASAAASCLADSRVAVLCATVTPAEYEAAQSCGLGAAPNVRLGVGLHPWWIADGRCGAAEVERTACLAETNRYVAEVGLDFAGARSESRDAQISALDAILAACENGGHLISLHAVQSADAVLDLLAKHGTCSNNDVVFHWFSGSGEDLFRAVQAGCSFSVNTRMLQTKRGRAYAQQIPLAQLLLETDAPSSAQQGADFTPQHHIAQLQETARIVEELRGAEALSIIAETSARLLELE